MPDRPTTLDIVAARSRGELTAEMAMMRLLLLHRSGDKAARELAAVASEYPATVVELCDLLHTRPHAAATVVAIADRADGIARATGPVSAMAACREFFDWAVQTSPEASVALYSLGAGSSLAVATQEVVGLLHRRDAIGHRRQILDVGCGIGRFVEALAGRVASITGVDMSTAMIAEAHARCGSLAGVALHVTSGRDLQFSGDAAFDTVIAVDSFPYAYQTGGPEFAFAYFSEMSRVLRPGGDILVFNLSYRGEPALDQAAAEHFAHCQSLELRCNGAAELRSWDGRTFHWHKPG